MRQIVNSTQISKWFSSTSRDAQELLPHLIRRLILATVPTDKLRLIGIAVGDDIRRRGYDGQVHSEAVHPFIPLGISVWEMGTGAPIEKFEHDYKNRTSDPRGIDPSKATFVFVTPHSWEGKANVEAIKRAEAVWADVRILDNADLETWLETCTAVARWIAGEMGVPISGMDDISTFGRVFAAKYRWKFNSKVVIGGRSEAVEKVSNWLADSANELLIEAESTEEAVAFVCAVIDQMPEGERDRVLASAVVVRDEGSIQYLLGQTTPLIVIPFGTDVSRRAKATASNSLRVISSQIRRADRALIDERSVRLGMVRREAIREALVADGLDEVQADRVAKESKGSLNAVLMMLSGGPDEPLPWSTGLHASRLAPLVLAGQWTPDNVHDAQALAKVADRTDREVTDVVHEWTGSTGPLIKRGSISDWLAWDFAWSVLSQGFDTFLLARFEQLVKDVLLAIDPQVEMEPGNRWSASVHGKEFAHSQALRSGVVGSIVQFGLHEERFSERTGLQHARFFVRLLLGGDTPDLGARWFSLASYLPDLAEAAPETFLECANTMAGNTSAVTLLFSEGGMFTSSRHTYLLWALERLAWSSAYLGSATVVLGKLAAVDPGGQLINRPANSLREIYVPWSPSTAASAAERLNVIDALFAAYPDVAWKLSMKLMPSDHDIASPTERPRWRSWPSRENQGVGAQEYWEFLEPLVRRMLIWSTNAPLRVVSLLPLYDDLWKTHQELADHFIKTVGDEALESWTDSEKATFSGVANELITKHHNFTNAEWAIPAAALEPVERLLSRAVPGNPIDRHIWLFIGDPSRQMKLSGTYEEQEKAVAVMRETAVREVIAAGGMQYVFDLISKSKSGHSIGYALSNVGIVTSDEVTLTTAWMEQKRVGQPSHNLDEAFRSYTAMSYFKEGKKWIEQFVARTCSTWKPDDLADLAMALPPTSMVWDQIEQWGGEVSDSYWRRIPIHHVSDQSSDLQRAVENLAKRDRFYRAVDLIGAYSYSAKTTGTLPVPRDLIVKVMFEAVKRAPSEEINASTGNSFSHHVGQLLDLLELHEVEQEVLARLEWAWFPVLKHTSHGVRTLEVLVSEDAASFIQLLTLAFKSSSEPVRELTDSERAAARQASDLLRDFKRVPGTNVTSSPKADDGDVSFVSGSVDGTKLTVWVDSVRAMARDVDRLRVCDSIVGQTLAYAPSDENGIWPCEVVRNLIERVASDDLEHGLSIGVHNKRGMHFVEPGGKQEKRIADKFRDFAVAVRNRWPRTGQILDSIARSYEREAEGNLARERFAEFE